MLCRLQTHALATLGAILIGSAALADPPPTYSTAVVDGPSGRIEAYDDPNFNQAVSEGFSGNVGAFSLVAKAEAHEGVLKNYVHAAIETGGLFIGRAPWYTSEATSYYAKELIINAPSPGFWSSHHSYLISVNISLEGTITKSLSSEVSLSYSATLDDREVYYRPMPSAFYGTTTALTGLAYSESYDVAWDYDLNDATWTDGDSLLVSLGVYLSAYAGGQGTHAFSATADFFNTAELNTVSLLTQDIGGAPELVASFDAEGNFLAGNPAFSMGYIPEPATLSLLLLGIPALLRRRA